MSPLLESQAQPLALPHHPQPLECLLFSLYRPGFLLFRANWSVVHDSAAGRTIIRTDDASTQRSPRRHRRFLRTVQAMKIVQRYLLENPFLRAKSSKTMNEICSKIENINCVPLGVPMQVSYRHDRQMHRGVLKAKKPVSTRPFSCVPRYQHKKPRLPCSINSFFIRFSNAFRFPKFNVFIKAFEFDDDERPFFDSVAFA